MSTSAGYLLILSPNLTIFSIMVIRKRLDIKGPALVFVTTTVHDWLPIFQDDEIVEIIACQLKETLDHFQTSLAGYIIMPSHLHLLLGFRHIETLSRFMQSFKILTAKAIKKILPDCYRELLHIDDRYRLWQPRFDDLVIYSEKQFRVKLEYVHNNPVRAGLVEKASDWRYSSASDWLEGKPGLLPIEKDFAWTK